uniref:Uncharacterized protein n=1 Tax=Rhizophora mucronata TaxID=61149 RepID=A0A2P2N8X7_RHIMU
MYWAEQHFGDRALVLMLVSWLNSRSRSAAGPGRLPWKSLFNFDLCGLH